jgi:hypothetical protein
LKQRYPELTDRRHANDQPWGTFLQGTSTSTLTFLSCVTYIIEISAWRCRQLLYHDGTYQNLAFSKLVFIILLCNQEASSSILLIISHQSSQIFLFAFTFMCMYRYTCTRVHVSCFPDDDRRSVRSQWCGARVARGFSTWYPKTKQLTFGATVDRNGRSIFPTHEEIQTCFHATNREIAFDSRQIIGQTTGIFVKSYAPLVRTFNA